MFQNGVVQSISQAVDVERIRISQCNQQLNKNGIKIEWKQDVGVLSVECEYDGSCGHYVMRACSHSSPIEGSKWNNKKSVT